MSEPIIKIENVNKWFGDFQVLKDINLDVSAKQKNETIKVKDKPPQAPVSTQTKPNDPPEIK